MSKITRPLNYTNRIISKPMEMNRKTSKKLVLPPKLKQEEKQNLLGFCIGNLYFWCGQIPVKKRIKG